MRRYRILKTEIIEDGQGVAIQFETEGEIHNLFWQCGYDGKGGLFRIRDNDFNAIHSCRMQTNMKNMT